MPTNPTPQINEETILKRYESLPEDLKEALMGISTADAIYEIGKKENLNVEKIGALAQEVGLIILGFVPSANFISDIKTELDINEENASAIANEVNNRIFLPIRESLKRLHGATWSEGLVKPPVKFEGEKLAEKKPGFPLKEITPAATVPSAPKPEIKMPAPQPAPKEPLIIKPMGVPHIAAPKEEITREVPRPMAAPSITPRPQPQPITPQTAVPEKKPAPVTPPTPREPKPPMRTPQPFMVRPPGAGLSQEIKRTLETKPEIAPTPKPAEGFAKTPPPPPALPTAEQRPRSFITPPAPTILQKLSENTPPKSSFPYPMPPKPAIPEPKKPGSDQYREPIE